MPGASSQRRPCTAVQSQRHLCIGSQASSIFASAARPCGSVTVASLHQQLGLAVQSQWRSWPATSSRWLFATAPLASKSFTIALRHGAPASNKPHPAEKSTPVWLAIWCTWAGFANSQLRCATFQSTYSYKCTSSLMPTWSRCSDIANLSAHLRRLPTPPPYLRRMRLSPGRWRRFLIGDMAAVWLGVLFEQFTARTNPCSRHLWGTLARSVASI